jgi:hypothetical protein
MKSNCPTNWSQLTKVWSNWMITQTDHHWLPVHYFIWHLPIDIIRFCQSQDVGPFACKSQRKNIYMIPVTITLLRNSSARNKNTKCCALGVDWIHHNKNVKSTWLLLFYNNALPLNKGGKHLPQVHNNDFLENISNWIKATLRKMKS